MSDIISGRLLKSEAFDTLDDLLRFLVHKKTTK